MDEYPDPYIGLDDLIHYRQNCWCLRSWCSGNGVDAQRQP